MRFLKIGVLTVLVAALVAACGTVQDTAQMLDMEGVTALEGDPNGWNWRASWNGRNGLDSENCGLVGEGERTAAGWIHWVFNTKGMSTDAKLVLAGTGSGEYAPGAPLNANVWHFYTPFFDPEGLTANIYLDGAPGRPGRLVISDWCAGEDEGDSLEVTKTAEPEFKRKHEWRIVKSVDPTTVELPQHGGSATVEWTIDVFYAALDSRFAVAGEIHIENISSTETAKTITSITDDLGFPGYDDIELSCVVKGVEGSEFDPKVEDVLPREIAYGEIWVCSYRVELSGAAAGDAGTNVVTVSVMNEDVPYTAEKAWAFDEPTTVVGEPIVHLWDGRLESGTPLDDWTRLATLNEEGGQWRYDETLTWGPGECGAKKTYINWAKLSTIETGFTGHPYLAVDRADLKVIWRCDDEPVEKLKVTKTADTSFERTHKWSIEKSVEPAELHLTYDGAGDGSVTWTVDVTYDGREDHDFAVSGAITIKNVGGLDAVITGVEDWLGGAAIDVDCGVTFPYTLPVGETLVCSYDEDGYAEGINKAKVTTERDTYRAEAPLVWGAPDEEWYATLYVIDESDLFGTVTLGTVTAPNGATFSYDKAFAWADYGPDVCGTFEYDNTAKLKLGEKVIDKDHATLKVHVECVEFAGETAWAANAQEPLEYRYQDPGNWATYVKYGGEAKTSTLFAGQTMNAGQVSFSAPVGGYVTITVSLSGAWEFDAVAENLKVQDYDTAPSGNPAPGLFDHKEDCDAAATACTIVVPANGYYGVHVNVGTWVPVDFD